jgi:nitroimidazol reductase NimA-like FMN-containing flavoprotein (pyridoxamine 5'-phosphate oxidase superfamily)
MNKVVSQIRDLALIENELSSGNVGSFAVVVEEDKIIQITTTFIYLDKNIYLFFGKDSELFEKINFESSASFSVVEAGKSIKKEEEFNFSPSYKFISISILGIIKKIEDQKLSDEIKKNYLKKYSKKSTMTKKDHAAFANLVMIDTEEIHATEEAGG